MSNLTNRYVAASVLLTALTMGAQVIPATPVRAGARASTVRRALSIFFPDRNFRTPYAEAINFGIQFHVPHGGTLDTNYVGKFARKLTVPLDLNPAM
jgi:hypothetical protein